MWAERREQRDVCFVREDLGQYLRPAVDLFKVLPRHSTSNDLLALSYSKIEGHVLLTNDKSLRSAAKTENVPFHGVLWLLDELVSENVLSGADAMVALNKMRDTGSRLPAEECEKRIRRWSK
jgi:predicted nucleic acid-binding protein